MEADGRHGMAKLRKFRGVVSWLLLTLCIASVSALRGEGHPGGPSEVGRLFSRTFGPSELGADPQNWSLVQDARGVLYAGNNLGVLEHDGAHWRLIPTRLGTTPRALATDAQGRVYVGGRGEFGYLAPNASGQMVFVPLDDRLAEGDRGFSEIWSLCATSQGVFFGSRERLFRWDGGSLRVWTPKGTFFSGFCVGDRYLIVDSAQGLLEMRGDTLDLVPGGAAFLAERPRFMVPWKGGAILWGSRTQGLVCFEGGRNRVWPSAANAYLVKHLLYGGIRLRNGALALATIHGGVVIVDEDGALVRILKREDGLGDPTVYALLEDQRTGLWLGQSKGVTYLEWPARFSTFKEEEGLDGVVVALHRHQGQLYASTHRGLFRLAEGPKRDGETGRRFVRVQGIQGQCWNLISMGEQLLVANFDGIYEVRGGLASKWRGGLGHTIALLSVSGDSERMFVGTDRGLFCIHRSKASTAAEGPIGGISEVVQTLVPSPDGSVWVGCDAPAAFRVSVAKSGGFEVERFGSEQGLPPDPWYFTALLHGEPVVYAPSGLYRRQPGSGRFESDPRISDLLHGEASPLFRVAQSPRGELWLGFQRPNNLLRRAQWNSNGRGEWDSLPAFSAQSALVYAMLPEVDGVVWFGGVEGLLRFDSSQSALWSPVLPQLRMLQPDGSVSAGQEGPTLPYAQRTLRFEYGMPQGEQVFITRYQVRLEGLDAEWSPWSSEVYRDYAGLREGRYRFRVRAQRGVGDTVAETSLPFRVLPPWHRRGWAYACYIGLIGLLLGLLHRLRMGLLQRRNALLEQRVADATEEIRQRETRLTEQARDLTEANQELKTLNEQKNRFLEIVNHDLRNPLHGIAMAAESLQAATDMEEVTEVARNIERESQDMGSLLLRFLDVAALEEGRSKPQQERLDVSELLAQAQARHQEQARRKRIRVRLELPAEPTHALGDASYLAAVLDNLLSNALKFSSPDAEVVLGASEAQGRTRLWVKDQGPGLTQEDRSKLFGRYARLSAKPTAGEPSLGLGLSLAQTMVEAMGGRIWAEERQEVGATFVVDLPSSS